MGVLVNQITWQAGTPGPQIMQRPFWKGEGKQGEIASASTSTLSLLCENANPIIIFFFKREGEKDLHTA